MRLPSKNSRRWRILAFFVLGLAIAVFAWGLRYKASLYNSTATPSHHMLAAKLLSNRERPADTAVQVERATMPLVVAVWAGFAFFAFFLFDRERQLRWTVQRAQNPQRRPAHKTTPQIFFRPPPSRRG
jgi:hypothetical protein